MALRFSKMHGIGNDFMVLDCRGERALPNAETIRRMGDRHFGIGFDQLLSIEAPQSPEALASYRIVNQDGSFADQCGNGARCVAHWLVQNGVTSAMQFKLDSPAGLITVQRQAGHYAIGMGHPRFAPNAIPLLANAEAADYPFVFETHVLHFAAVSMGNPHAVFVVPAVDEAPVADLGTALQGSGLFPRGVNVGFAEIIDAGRIRLRVFERGVGETLACGSGACAAAACLMRQGLVARTLAVQLPGGTLMIDWPDDAASITMTGPAQRVFDGEWFDD
jgi:diaminopimelate epimerase